MLQVAGNISIPLDQPGGRFVHMPSQLDLNRQMEKLNSLGLEGWEAVGFTGGADFLSEPSNVNTFVLLKRQIPGQD